MSRELVYTGFVSLDGVLDSPGHPSEGHRGGGWVGDVDFVPEAFALKAEELTETAALMFGRRSYEAFAKTWPGSEDHAAYKELPKFVVSTSLSEDALVDGWGRRRSCDRTRTSPRSGSRTAGPSSSTAARSSRGACPTRT